MPINIHGTGSSVTDAEKSTWNAKQAALGFTPENVANKGQINGYAELGADGKVPSAQLPAIPEGHTHSNKTILDKITTGTAGSYNLDSFTTDSEFNEVIIARNVYASLNARLNDIAGNIDSGLFTETETEPLIDGGAF